MSKTKAKAKVVSADIQFAFFNQLWLFYSQNRGMVRTHYRDLTKKFLDFNNPERNPKAFLRKPQFDALEIYIFLKEYLGNAHIEEIFRDWHERKGRFAGRGVGDGGSQQQTADMFDRLTREQYQAVYSRMENGSRAYANHIYALTMGTGKTILMATCIFYEFLLANKHPKEKNYCHNALVFAPDKTVLQSLREIESFDMAKVVPPEYVNFLTAHIRFHYLEEAGTSLDTLDKSRFNLIVSNTQKIILKKIRKEPSATDQLFGSGKALYEAGNVYAQNEDLYKFDQPENEAELATNQRFEKLRRLEQLGIYVDEAHHAFGAALAKDMGVGKASDTSLRTTIDMLAASLTRAGTHVVACYNYTGTPYVGREVLPEVVYAYGLKEAIDRGLLKRVALNSYTNTKTTEFVRIAIEDFLAQTEGLRPEGKLPKLAFFAATIDEVTKELRPAVEKILLEKGIPTSSILVNVGDEKVTTNDDIREFNNLDNPVSTKQFILLVNKGREGWNCRSLFGVALFREPKSKIFVLQATMRCLRAIGDYQHTGHVYLTEENLAILNDELQENFRISADEMQQLASDKEKVEVHVAKPPVIVRLRRVRRTFDIKEKVLQEGVSLGIDRDDDEAWRTLTEGYRIVHTRKQGLSAADAAMRGGETEQDLTHLREKREFSALTLVAEISRYLNRSPLEIEGLLEKTAEGLDKILAAVNDFNELLYDVVIPRLFTELYDLTPNEQVEEHPVELVKTPPPGRDHYPVMAAPDKIVRASDVGADKRGKSFHLDAYCFDSNPERELFWSLINEGRVKKVYFTGMLTHGQSDFYIQYIDPDSHTVRSYYPDFLFEKQDGTFVIVEVKGDNMIEDAVVQAKAAYANQIAEASGMSYKVIKGSDANTKNYSGLLE